MPTPHSAGCAVKQPMAQDKAHAPADAALHPCQQDDFLKTWFAQNREALFGVSRYIFSHPEISQEEHLSSRCLADYLEAQGFTLQWGAGGFKTAFVAQWGEGRPVLGFLAEYDALPGLAQKAEPRQTACPGPGHGCGHNLLGTGCAGAASALKARMEQAGLSGTLRVYGCPAEETVIGKGRMDAQGVFSDLDAAITWHPFDRNRISYDIWLSQIVKDYVFHGRSAHAAKHPDQGRSALDGAELMNVGVNYLREHVPDDVRIHYTYTNTGGPANIVPDLAATNYFIRSGNHARTQAIADRVDDCARGAALMTGTQVEIKTRTSTPEMKTNRPLAQAFYAAMARVPLPAYTAEEEAFAKELIENAKLPAPSGGTGSCFSGLYPLEERPSLFPVGTDVSLVSHRIPTVMLSAATMCLGTPLHHWAVTAQAGMSIGEKGMLYAAQSMAEGALALLLDPAILENAWRAFQEDTP